MYANKAKLIKKYTKISKVLDEFAKICSGYSNLEPDELKNIVESLFSFSKFKEGDTVYLAKTPEIKKDSGLSYCQHFLVKGAECKVSEIYINCDDKGIPEFSYLVVPVVQTWICDSQNIVKILDSEDLSSFSFSEDSLTKDQPKVPANKSWVEKYRNEKYIIMTTCTEGKIETTLKKEGSEVCSTSLDFSIKKTCPTCGK